MCEGSICACGAPSSAFAVNVEAHRQRLARRSHQGKSAAPRATSREAAHEIEDAAGIHVFHSVWRPDPASMRPTNAILDFDGAAPVGGSREAGL